MRKQKILLVGDINVDSIWPIDGMPVPGRDALVDMIQTGVGGAVLNSTIVLDQFGLDTVLIGCIGTDLWGKYVLESISHTKIDLSNLQYSDAADTGLDFIFVTPDGERTMFGYRGANVHLDPEKISEGVFQQSHLLHISGYALLEPPQCDAVWQAVNFADKHHLPISIDTGLEPVIQKPDDFRKLLPKLKICITGEEEIRVLLGSTSVEDAAEKLIQAGVEIAVIKLGAKGSYIKTKEENFFCPAFSVVVKDTTGAGDSFSAGFIFGWAQGMSLMTSALFASVCGALAATVEGAGLSLPGRQKIHNFLSSISPQDDAYDKELFQEMRNSLS